MLDIKCSNGVTEIGLARPPVNALNLDLLEALISELEKSFRNSSQVVIIKGKGSIFSAGVDVPELINESRNGVAVFWGRFFKLMHTVLAAPVPVIAAITGPAPAGGAVLAIHCDYRIAAAGEYKIGLNEVQVGLAVPEPILAVLCQLVGRREAARLAMQGAMLKPAEALRAGLVDELVPAEEVVERSRLFANELMRLPPVAMNTTRLNAKADVLAAHVSNDAIRLMTDYWFSEETQATMKKLVAELGK